MPLSVLDPYILNEEGPAHRVTFFMGHACANRKSPKVTPWEMLIIQRFGRPIFVTHDND